MDHHALGLVTPEEGKALKEAGYERAPEFGDVHWHAARGETWLVTQPDSMAPQLDNGQCTLDVEVGELRGDFTRLPRLQELVEFYVSQRPHDAQTMLIYRNGSVGMACTSMPSAGAGFVKIYGKDAKNALEAAVEAVLHVLGQAPVERSAPALDQPPMPGPIISAPVMPVRYEHRLEEVTADNGSGHCDTMASEGWALQHMCLSADQFGYALLWRRVAPLPAPTGL